MINCIKHGLSQDWVTLLFVRSFVVKSYAVFHGFPPFGLVDTGIITGISSNVNRKNKKYLYKQINAFALNLNHFVTKRTNEPRYEADD